MVKGFFYNSVGGDRKYNGNSVNESKRPFYKDGVFAGHMEVTAKGEGMKIVVDGGEKTGFAWINAHTIHNTTPLEIDVSRAGGTLDRIDRVVLRNDETERKPTIYILKGTFSPTPVAPELTNTDTIQEKCLAEINVKAGAIEITQEDITDTRADTTVCGFVASQFQEFDFSQWQKQFEAYFAKLRNQYEREWNTWFKNKQDELSGDVAGNLQLQIDEAEKKIQDLNKRPSVCYAQIDGTYTTAFVEYEKIETHGFLGSEDGDLIICRNGALLKSTGQGSSGLHVRYIAGI